MDPFETKYALEHLTLLVDTREQNTPAFRRRMKDTGLPWERKKLDFGDYSTRCELEDGRVLDFSQALAVERKMSLDELCACYCRERKRFAKEFERARLAGAKLYLLIENGDWERAYHGDYRSQMSPEALVASMTAWLARYNCQLLFSTPELSGRLIRDVLYRETKERLEQLPEEEAPYGGSV